jgi:hypothetical protein
MDCKRAIVNRYDVQAMNGNKCVAHYSGSYLKKLHNITINFQAQENPQLTT